MLFTFQGVRGYKGGLVLFSKSNGARPPSRLHLFALAMGECCTDLLPLRRTNRGETISFVVVFGCAEGSDHVASLFVNRDHFRQETKRPRLRLVEWPVFMLISATVPHCRRTVVVHVTRHYYCQ